LLGTGGDELFNIPFRDAPISSETFASLYASALPLPKQQPSSLVRWRKDFDVGATASLRSRLEQNVGAPIARSTKRSYLGEDLQLVHPVSPIARHNIIGRLRSVTSNARKLAQSLTLTVDTAWSGFTTVTRLLLPHRICSRLKIAWTKAGKDWVKYPSRISSNSPTTGRSAIRMLGRLPKWKFLFRVNRTAKRIKRNYRKHLRYLEKKHEKFQRLPAMLKSAKITASWVWRGGAMKKYHVRYGSNHLSKGFANRSKLKDVKTYLKSAVFTSAEKYVRMGTAPDLYYSMPFRTEVAPALEATLDHDAVLFPLEFELEEDRNDIIASEVAFILYNSQPLDVARFDTEKTLLCYDYEYMLEEEELLALDESSDNHFYDSFRFAAFVAPLYIVWTALHLMGGGGIIDIGVPSRTTCRVYTLGTLSCPSYLLYCC